MPPDDQNGCPERKKLVKIGRPTKNGGIRFLESIDRHVVKLDRQNAQGRSRLPNLWKELIHSCNYFSCAQKHKPSVVFPRVYIMQF